MVVDEIIYTLESNGLTPVSNFYNQITEISVSNEQFGLYMYVERNVEVSYHIDLYDVTVLSEWYHYDNFSVFTFNEQIEHYCEVYDNLIEHIYSFLNANSL